MEWIQDPYVLVDESARADVEAVHAFLSNSYWAAGVPREVVQRCIDGSLCFSLFHGRDQVGFARLDARDPRRARPLRKVRIHAAGVTRALHGEARPRSLRADGQSAPHPVKSPR
jgi:hypothetical protein